MSSHFSRCIGGLTALAIIVASPAALALPDNVAGMIAESVRTQRAQGSVSVDVGPGTNIVPDDETKTRAKREERKKREDAKRQEQAAKKAVSDAEKKAEDAKDEVEEKAEEEKKEAKKAAKASLDLPIGWYVAAAGLSGLGYLTGLLSASAVRDLRDPNKHINRDETQALYNRAYYGSIVSNGFYALSGAAGGWAAYQTSSAVQDYIKAKASLAAASQPIPQQSEVVAAAAAAPAELRIPEPPPVSGAFAVSPKGDVSLFLSVSF